MANRISILVALDGADDGLRRAVQSAERSLQQLADDARTAGQRASDGLSRLNQGVSDLGQQIGDAKTQLLAFLSIQWLIQQAQQIIAIVDAWNLMNARLKLATAGSRELAVAQSELYAIAQRIGVPIAETATLYGKLQQAMRLMGREQQDALQITESISQALRISGATASEAQSALLQFGQALTSGVLRGDEFNSVMESSPRLAQALAEGLNVPIGRLRAMAEEGRLTSNVVVQALLSQKDRLTLEYAQMPQTAEAAFERLKNAARQWINQFDAATELTRRVTESLAWLARHLDEVLQAIKRLVELGLVILIYRLLPALATAWQTAGAAAVTAANATQAAWATANLSVSGAIASAGALKVAFGALAALFAGWEIGTLLAEQFATVRLAGIALARVFLHWFELLQTGWEALQAVFTDDTLDAVAARHQQRLAAMGVTLAQMRDDAQNQGTAVKQAITQAADAAVELQRRLDAVRQGTQDATARGAEAVHGALEKLNGRLAELDRTAQTAQQTINTALTQMAAAYQTQQQGLEAQAQRRIDLIRQEWAERQAALQVGVQSEMETLRQSTAALIESSRQQVQVRRELLAETLKGIDTESAARREAARHQGATEEERRTRVARIDNEILVTKRQTLTQALQEYVRHIDVLNQEANRHLVEIKRIEDEKRQLTQSTQDRIRELQRSALTEFEGYQDQRAQIAEKQAAAQAALEAGEFTRAKQLAQQAQDLAAQTAHAVRQGDVEVVTQKQAVAAAIEAIHRSEALTVAALEAEKQAHQAAADGALSARGAIEQSIQHTQQQIETLTRQLQEGLTLSIDADTQKFQAALAELDTAMAEKAQLVPIKMDLEAAKQQLAEFELALKEGKTLPVDADVSRAETALAALKQYAEGATQLELKVATEKAESAVHFVDSQLKALNQLETQSRHQVVSNLPAVKTDLQSLNGVTTHSEHIIHVKKIEAHAAGGSVGTYAVGGGTYAVGISRLATGGAVPQFPRQRDGLIPGSGEGDTVPRTLDAGAFVLRKAAVQRYGGALLAKLAGLAHFAQGGRVPAGGIAAGTASGRTGTAAGRTGRIPGSREDEDEPIRRPQRNRLVMEAKKLIELGMQGVDEYTTWVQNRYGAGASVDLRVSSLRQYRAQAAQDVPILEGLEQRRELTGAETAEVQRIQAVWRAAMSQPMVFGRDLERDLLDYMEQHQGEFYAQGGFAASDRVPALLTPGEYVVSREAVARHGVGLFEALNAMVWPVDQLAKRVRGYATGGLVAYAAGDRAYAADGVLRLPSTDPLAAVVGEFAGLLQRSMPKVPDVTPPAPARTIRVELAAAGQQVPVMVAAQDETRLLDLLKQAQARSW